MQRLLRQTVLSIGLLFSCLALFGQERMISGTVTADNATPLSGVTVMVKGTNRVTQTDASGRFTISAATGQLLALSYVGYPGKEVTVGSSNTLDVDMGAAGTTMQDVVVVGYGTQRRGNLTGAVSTVNVDRTLGGRPIPDVGRGLQGAASGLSVTIPSGEVGSDPIIKIRGVIGSLQGGSSPLILLDNVEIPSIQVVNPNDIESITVLKDAASASIYGSKAAFGVILITTKKGVRGGKPQINYSNNFSWQNVWKDLDMADINGLKYTVDAAERVGTTTPTGAFYYTTRESYERALAWKQKYGNTIGANDPTVYGRDWYVNPANSAQKMGVRTYDPYDYMVKEWAPSQQHNLSIGHTVGKTSYNIGLGILDQSGMLKPAKSDKFTRHNLSMKVSSELNKFITIRGGALYSRRNKEYAYVTNSTTADPWLYLYRWSSMYPLGSDENGDPIRSPNSEVAAANTANILRNYLNASLGSTINITNNWKVDFDYTYTNQDETWKRPGTRYTGRNSWSAPVARFDASGNRVYVNGEGQVVPSTATGAMPAFDLNKETYTAPGAAPDHFIRRAENFFSHTINAFTTYNLNIKQDHAFKFILGVNRVTATTEWQSSQINQLLDINNPQINFGTLNPAVDGNKSWEAQVGYFGRVNYAFRNKYLIEGNLRYDGSSKFPSSLWWRWYPSFSAGWVASEEKFMDWAKPVLSSLKFRGSWGTIGDQSVPNTLYLSLIDPGQSSWIGANGTRLFSASTPSSVYSNIQWQDIETKNIGVDLGIFKNKINVSLDVFERNTNNMIVPQEGIPLTFGVSPPVGNFGSLQTRGWEFTLNMNHTFSNGLGINFRGNISDAKTILNNYGSGTQVTGNYNGKDIGEIWGYRTDRLYQLSDFELDANGKPILITLTAAESAIHAGKQAYKLKAVDGKKPVYQPFLQNSANFRFGPGDVKFRDMNGDGEINNGNGTLADHGDLEVIGNCTPRYEYGFRLGADFKGVDFSAFFQGVGRRQIWGDGDLAIAGYHSSDGAMA